MSSISYEEILEVSSLLENHHAIFSKIWQISKINFRDNIDTAYVSFDSSGQFLDFSFNKNFWESLDIYQKSFVFCHECLHILLAHGPRLQKLDKEIGNIAADIVINEMLISDFNFDRNLLGKIGIKGCFLDTIFDKKDIEYDKSTEYYYNKLIKDKKYPSYFIIDCHDSLKNNTEGASELINDIIDSCNNFDKKTIQKKLSDEEVEVCKKAGVLPGGLCKTIVIDNPPIKRKWETVIKRWALSKLKNEEKDLTQWTRTNRRFAAIKSKLILPSDMEIEDINKEKERIKVVFFQDTSGSCYSLAQRFFKAAKSMPPDKFDVELYCFDTQVYKTSLKSGKLYGFGGTCFNILEQYVYNTIAECDRKKYPQAIFVITDGYGTNIRPHIPERWHWFLSTDSTYCIPETCNIYKLKDFE